MDISKALLEKYELGQCNDEELAAVQKWLESEDWDDLEFSQEVKPGVKEGMWADIAEVMDSTPIPKLEKQNPFLKKYRYAIAAASIVLLIGGYYSLALQKEEESNFQASNIEPGVVSFTKDAFDMVLSTNSEASIDFETGSIVLTGDIMFRPKRDFVLQDERSNQVFNFKSGEVYFVSDREEQKKLIILSKKEMIFLPPAIQRKIKQQFHIS